MPKSANPDVSFELFPRAMLNDAEIRLTPDNHSEVEPPLPIPNRVVKRLSADDSADYLCESRTLSGTHKSQMPDSWSGICFLGDTASDSGV